MVFSFPDARWNADRQAMEFGVEIGEYSGVVRVPRRVFQRLLPERPTPERCVEAYYLQRDPVREHRRAEAASADVICEGFPFQIASGWNTPIRSIHMPFRNADLASLELELRAKLIDDFSAEVLTGALAVLDAPSNPIRLNQFAAAMRELFGHT